MYGLHTVFLAGKSPNIRSYTVYVYIGFWPTLRVCGTLEDSSKGILCFSLGMSLMLGKVRAERALSALFGMCS